MKLYGMGASRSLRAVWAAEEAGADYEYVAVNARAGELGSPEFLALNPGGKVPVLVDGGLVLTESAVIVTWLGERDPAADLVPEPRTPERASYDAWCFFVLTELEQPLWSIGKHKFALPRDWRIPEMRETARKEWARAEKVMAARFGEGPCVLGERFSMADVLAGHTLEWARRFDVEIVDERLDAYRQRMLERPAWLRACARAGVDPR